MDLVKALAELEQDPELHMARLLVLLHAFLGERPDERLQGMTKVAKLDFLLRYPVLLERALQAKGRSTQAVKVQPHEKTSVESKMVRYRFGPWDHRYHRLFDLLRARGLVQVGIEGKTTTVGLTEQGRAVAATLARSESYADIARRAGALKTHFDISATALKDFVYATFPEIVDMKKNEAIAL